MSSASTTMVSPHPKSARKTFGGLLLQANDEFLTVFKHCYLSRNAFGSWSIIESLAVGFESP